MTYGTGENMASAAAEELGCRCGCVITEGSDGVGGRMGATVEHIPEDDLVFLFFLDFFPVDFLFLVCIVSLQSVSGRLNCV